MSTFELDIGDFTAFEEQGEPFHLIENESEITLPIRKLNLELTCPVCLGILRKTVTVMDCLHRFCKSCIQTSLRVGRRECPSCRAKCTSKRNLREDPNFDSLIAKIYPNLEEYIKQQDQEINDVSKRTLEDQSSTMAKIQEGIARQLRANSTNYLPSSKPAAPAAPAPSSNKRKSSSSSSSSSRSKKKKVEEPLPPPPPPPVDLPRPGYYFGVLKGLLNPQFYSSFQPPEMTVKFEKGEIDSVENFPTLPSLPKPYVRIEKKATCTQISKFIIQQLQQTSPSPLFANLNEESLLIQVRRAKPITSVELEPNENTLHDEFVTFAGPQTMQLLLDTNFPTCPSEITMVYSYHKTSQSAQIAQEEANQEQIENQQRLQLQQLLEQADTDDSAAVDNADNTEDNPAQPQHDSQSGSQLENP